MSPEAWVALHAAPIAVCAFVIVFRHRPRGASFGVANGVTSVRLLIASLLAGAALVAISAGRGIIDPMTWVLFSMAVAGLLLDGLDGALARALGQTSDFGARFDMEVDAFQILALSILAMALGKAGWWVLLGGLVRYAFVAAGLMWPKLNTPLPPSWRRKACAVLQGGSLALLVAPIVVPPFSSAIAAISLAMLLASFAIDVIWALRHG